MWRLGTWFGGGLGSAGLTVGLDGTIGFMVGLKSLNGLFQL